MFTRLRSLSAAALVAGALVVSASAQDPNASAPTPAPANLAYIEGSVDVVLEGVTERADPPMLLLEGDVVRTRNGRAEVVFGDGTLLHVSHDAELELLGPEHLRLLSGRIVLRMSHSAAQPYVIDTPTSSVRMDAQGEYGISADRLGRLDVSVARGGALVGDGPTGVRLRGGEMATVLAAGGRPVIQRYNSARWDAFAQWAYERTNGFAASQSAAQLPYELRPYAPVLDQHGRWDYVAPYGNVWFPSVGAAWRPYYDGSWSFTRYGWTWSGRDRFAWPTHHYGRWGFTGSFWYWIPAKVWGPAWVSWGSAPGYVSWAPLGWDNRPAIRFWDRRDHPAYRPEYSPWRGWTVMPRDHFRPRGSVRASAVDGERLDEATRRAMVIENTLPPTRGQAVPRDTVATPGGRGNVRRPPAAAASSTSGATATAPAATADTIVPNSRSTRGYPGVARRPAPAAPAPAAAPGASPSARDDERRGAVRQGTPSGAARDDPPGVAPVVAPPQSQRPDPRASEPRAAEPRRAVPRGEPSTQPRSEPPSRPRAEPGAQSPPPAERGGAVQRGGARSGPAAGAPSGSQPRPSGADGGARRRPPS